MNRNDDEDYSSFFLIDPSFSTFFTGMNFFSLLVCFFFGLFELKFFEKKTLLNTLKYSSTLFNSSMLRQQKKHQCLNEDEKKINFHTTTTENKTKKTTINILATIMIIIMKNDDDDDEQNNKITMEFDRNKFLFYFIKRFLDS